MVNTPADAPLSQSMALSPTKTVSALSIPRLFIRHGIASHERGKTTLKPQLVEYPLRKGELLIGRDGKHLPRSAEMPHRVFHSGIKASLVNKIFGIILEKNTARLVYPLRGLIRHDLLEKAPYSPSDIRLYFGNRHRRESHLPKRSVGGMGYVAARIHEGSVKVEYYEVFFNHPQHGESPFLMMLNCHYNKYLTLSSTGIPRFPAPL